MKIAVKPDQACRAGSAALIAVVIIGIIAALASANSALMSNLGRRLKEIEKRQVERAREKPVSAPKGPDTNGQSARH